MEQLLESTEDEEVLIETYWNVKSGRSSGEYRPEYRINRNILECKERKNRRKNERNEY